MIVTKSDILLEAFSKLRINGLTVNATPEDTSLALRRLSSLIAALPWSIGYLQPESYGDDDPNDDSGLTASLVDPVSTLLAYRIAPDFGKQVSMMDKIEAESAIARQFVEVGGGKYPTTLPTGIANEDYDGDQFYDGSQPYENASYELP